MTAALPLARWVCWHCGRLLGWYGMEAKGVSVRVRCPTCGKLNQPH